MQLERLLRSQGFGSRPDCRALIRSGKVAIEGSTCDDPFAEFEPEGLCFTVDGCDWVYRKSVYIALNKPSNFECSHRPIHYPSVYTLLPKALVARGVQAVGRLDVDTTGLLLLSDDGQFIHTFTSPKKNIAKVYEVTTRHPVDQSQLQVLLSGVQLNDEPAPISARACELVSERCLLLTVTEGKYHLVKRMIAAAGNRVEQLKRISIGGFELPRHLALGEWIWLDSSDLNQLAVKV